jgi:ADP-ribose pyrophosphatase
MKKNGPFTIISSEIKYKNPWIEVREDKVLRPEGKEGIFGTIDYGRGVSVVALDSKRNIYLEREYYYVLERYGTQTPSGGIDGEESPLDAAKHELLEETGATSERWIELGVIDALTMILKHPSHLFLALNVTIVQEPESGIERIVIPFDEAYKMVLDGEITHAPSCVAIMKAKAYLDSHGV